MNADRPFRDLIAEWREDAYGAENDSGYCRGAKFALRKCAQDLEEHLDIQAAECATCEPEGVFATDGTGPYDCYVCGKRAAALNEGDGNG